MVSEMIMSDFANFELEWSMFHAALRSYKSELYLGKEICDHAAKSVLEKVWIQIGNCKRNGIVATAEAKKFHETVMERQNFRLSLVSSKETIDIVRKFKNNDDRSSENFDKTKVMIFKVNYVETANNENISRFSEQYGSFLALHGSPVNRFYSILQNGLHLPKPKDDPGLYGFGIYLTNKLDVALHFAQAHLFDCGWLQDESIKIVAICEVVKHPTAVVRREHQTSDGFSFDSGIPPEYFLVKDECMVRVSHIMVETSCPLSFLESRARFKLGRNVNEASIMDTVAGTFRRNWLLYIIAIYVGILVMIALLNGRYLIFTDWDNSDLLSVDD